MKILGIGAHPDDLEFGCGGALYGLAQKGHSIHMLVITSGEVGGNESSRIREQERSAEFLKAGLYWGGYRDTDIPMTRELIQTVERHINDIKPDIIFAHYWDDTHQDHRKVAQAVITASRYSRNVLFYEVPTTINFSPSIFADIGGNLAHKLRLLRCHKSQVYKTNVPKLSIIESVKSAAIFRGYQNRIKYAEAFMPQRFSFDLICKP